MITNDFFSTDTPLYSQKTVTLLLAVLILSGLALRLHLQWERSFTGDEVGTLLYMRESYSYLMSHVTMWLTMNFFIITLKVMTELFGQNQVVMLLLPLGTGLATIPLTYALARKALSQEASLAAAAFVAFNPYLLYYSVVIRAYALMVFFAVLVLYCYLNWRENKTLLNGILCSLSAFLLIFFQPNSSYFMIFIVLGACCDIFADRGRNLAKTFCTLILPASAALAALVAIYYPLVPYVRAYRDHWSYTAPTSIDYIPHVLPLYFGSWYGIFLALVFFFTGLRGAYQGKGLMIRFALAIVVPMLLASASGFSCYPWALGRILLYILVFMLIIMAAGLETIAKALVLSQRKRLVVLVLGVLLLSAFSWPRMEYYYSLAEKLPAQKIADYLRPKCRTGDIVLSVDMTVLQLRPYLDNAQRLFQYLDKTDTEELRAPETITCYLLVSDWISISRFHDWKLKTAHPTHFIGETEIVTYAGTRLEILRAIFNDLLATVDDKLDPQFKFYYGALLRLYDTLSPLEDLHVDHARLVDRYYNAEKQFDFKRFAPPQFIFKPE